MTGDERLDDLAARIVDREPIDWESETGDEEMSTPMRNLRMVERIRSLHLDAEAEATPTRPFLLGNAGDEGPTEGGLRPGARWGSLELKQRVGSGSYGEVWRAWDPQLQTHVALKLLFPRGQRTEDVLREARQMARVRHENVVQVHGAAVHGGHVGIWYQYIVGRTLERQLEEQGPMGPAEAAVVGINLLGAVAAVHAAGLVHRDIKTSNVMREEGGRIVLMDFGTVVDREAIASLSATDAFTGTAPYMAPEIFDGQPASNASDVYAMGVLLYRLVTNRYPRRVERGSARPGETTPLRDARPDLPAAFIRVVERAMAASPAERYASAGEMERDLAAFVARESGIVGTARPAQPERKSRRLRTLFAVPALAVALWVVWSAATGGALEVDAALFREGADGSQERLSSGGRVRPGDNLFLELETTEDAYVYVFTEDQEGRAYLLFPLAGLDLSNPVPGKRQHELPGVLQGEKLYWGVDTAGGEESVYVVAAERPVDLLESLVRDLPPAQWGAPQPLDPERVTRGIGMLNPAPPGSEDHGGAGLSGTFGKLADRAEHESDLWAWSIRLANPAR